MVIVEALVLGLVVWAGFYLIGKGMVVLGHILDPEEPDAPTAPVEEGDEP